MTPRFPRRAFESRLYPIGPLCLNRIAASFWELTSYGKPPQALEHSGHGIVLQGHGLVAYEPLVMQGIGNMTLASRMAAEITKWQSDAVFVDAGLRSLGFTVSEVNFGGKATNELYANKRSEMWDALAKWLRAGGVIPNHAELKTDLATPTYSFNAAGKLVLEPDSLHRRADRRAIAARSQVRTVAA
jgi:hypothetical protein